MLYFIGLFFLSAGLNAVAVTLSDAYTQLKTSVRGCSVFSGMSIHSNYTFLPGDVTSNISFALSTITISIAESRGARRSQFRFYLMLVAQSIEVAPNLGFPIGTNNLQRALISGISQNLPKSKRLITRIREEIPRDVPRVVVPKGNGVPLASKGLRFLPYARFDLTVTHPNFFLIAAAAR